MVYFLKADAALREEVSITLKCFAELDGIGMIDESRNVKRVLQEVQNHFKRTGTKINAL